MNLEIGTLCYNRKAAEIKYDLTVSSPRVEPEISSFLTAVICKSHDQGNRTNRLREPYGYPSGHTLGPPTFSETILPAMLGESRIAKILSSTVTLINQIRSQKDLWIQSSNRDPTLLKVALFSANVVNVARVIFSKEDPLEQSLNGLPLLPKMTARMQNKKDKGQDIFRWG